ncbi:MAG: multidrug efflux MFS transporter [Firmicutes bacterium]|nr:multidrug efflux MFS transporter [Bacillota bacterium]
MPYYKRNLIILSISIFLTACSWNQISPFLGFYIESMDPTANVALWSSMAFAAHFVSAFFAQPLWGKLGDRVGRKPMIMRAGFGLPVIYLGFALSTKPWHLAAWRFANGILTGFIPGSITLIATNTPETAAARAIAIAQSANAAGTMVGPVLGGVLAGIFGYRLSMKVSALILLASTLAVGFLVKERKTAAPPEKSTVTDDLKIVFKSPVLPVVLFAILITNILTLSMTPLLTLYLRELEPAVSGMASGIIFSLPGIGFVLAAYRWTALGEKIGFEQAFMFGLAGAGISMTALTFLPNLWSFGGGYFMYGCFAAALAPATACLIATEVPEDFRGRAYGLQQSASMLGGLVGPLLAGWVGDIMGLSRAFLFTGIVSLAGGFYLARQFQNIKFKVDAEKTKETDRYVISR